MLLKNLIPAIIIVSLAFIMACSSNHSGHKKNSGYNGAIIIVGNPSAIAEGNSQMLSVRLAEQPKKDTEIAISISNPQLLSINGAQSASLVFTKANYAIAQAITLYSLKDENSANEKITVSLTAVDGAANASFEMTIIDIDTMNILLTGDTSLAEGANGSLGVRLSQQPLVPVTVRLSSDNDTGMNINPSVFIFSPQNYSVPQTATIQAIKDSDQDSGVISISATTDGIPTASYTLNILDVDTAIILNGSLIMGEETSTVLGVKLSGNPGQTRTVILSASDPGRVSISPSTLVFTGDNYSIEQNVTISALADADAFIQAMILYAAGDGLVGASLSINVADNDSQQIIISGNASVNEGNSTLLGVYLLCDPLFDADVTLSSSNNTAVTTEPGTITFTPYNYNIPQYVKIKGVVDANYVNESVVITASSPGIPDVTHSVATIENSILVSGGTSVNEGSSAIMTVRLEHAIDESMTVALTSDNSASVSVTPASLTFTADNYNVPQNITLRGVIDANTSSESVTVTTSASGMPDVTKTINTIENSLIVTGPTIMNEGDSVVVSVHLSNQIDDNAAVAIVPGDATQLNPNPAAITFTSANYNIPQAVTVESLANYVTGDATVDLDISSAGMAGVVHSIQISDYFNTATIDLFPTEIADVTGSNNASDIRVLNTKDMTGSLWSPARYITFFPAGGSTYAGTIKFALPGGIRADDVTQLDIKTCYRGPNDPVYQTWAWKLYNFENSLWESLGDNAFAVANTWTTQTWSKNVSVDEYINPGNEIHIQFSSDNDVDLASLDWLVITATYNSNNRYPTFARIPNAIAMAIDDLGWKDYGPPDNTRNATNADYQTVINVGHNAGTRIMTAWILQHFDPDTISATPAYNYPNVSSYLTEEGLAWNNTTGTTKHTTNDHTLMAMMQTNAAWIELGLHGVSHSHFDSGFVETDAEFAQVFPWGDPNYGTSRSWGLDNSRAHLNCFTDILRHYFDAETASFPKSFVAPAHGYYWGDAGDGNSSETLGVVLNEFGVKYVNGGLGVCTRTSANYIIDNGVLFIDRAYGSNYNTENQTAWYGSWNDFDYPYYPDDGYGWIEAHFPNFWNGETDWTNYLKGLNNDRFRFLAKNTAQTSSQQMYRQYATINGYGGTYTIDVSAMPDTVYANNLLGALVLKTPLFGKHIQSAAIDKDAQVVGYYEDDYGYGYLIIGHKTNPMGRLSKTGYTLNAALGPERMPVYIDQAGTTYNVFSFTTTSTTAAIALEVYGTQDIKIKLPFVPATVTSSSSDITVLGWSWSNPFVTIQIQGKDIMGETGTINIGQ